MILALGIIFYNTFGIEGIIYAIALSYFPYAIVVYNGFRNTKVDFSVLKPRVSFVTETYFLQLTQVARSQGDKLVI